MAFQKIEESLTNLWILETAQYITFNVSDLCMYKNF